MILHKAWGGPQKTVLMNNNQFIKNSSLGA